MGKNTFAHIAVFGANLIYGMNYTLAKGPMGEGYLGPRAFIIFRVLGALLLFGIMRLLMKSQKIEPKDYFRLALCGLFGVCLNQVLFFEGLALTSEVNSAIMMTSNPILVLIIAAILIKERITPLKILGISLGTLGAYLIISSGTSTRESSYIGDILVLLNSAAYALYVVLVKPLMKKYNPILILSWIFLFGSLLVLPLGFSQFSEINWEMPPHIIWSIVFVVICTTFFAYLLNIYGLKRLNPSTVSAYIYLQPVLATLFALAVNYSEKVNDLSWEKAFYAILIFIGVYFVSKPQKKALNLKA